MKPLAIYVHVPFCGQRCAYCHFDIKILHPKTDRSAVYADYVAAVCAEIIHRAAKLCDREVTSIFFGGGTPSRLPIAALTQILDCIKHHLLISPEVEISAEANPEDIHAEYAAGLFRMGMTRISLGVQSFDDHVLAASGRPHNGNIAVEAVRAFKDMPHGVSLDLMLGLPYQDETVLQADLAIVSDLQPQHVSVYMLERDLPTPLDKKADRLPMVDEDTQAALYEITCMNLAKQGYTHYEISNFAKPGFDCRHNLTYWHCGDYLGIGPAAVGRVSHELMINAPRLRDYLKAVNEIGHGSVEVEHWDAARLEQEQRVQGIRLAEGLVWSEIPSDIQKALQPYLDEGLLEMQKERVRLTDRGKLLGNEVFEALI